MEGHLSESAGGPLPGGPPALRLHPWVEPFPSASGDVYLMRPGWGADVVVRSPAAADRRVLDDLLGGGSVAAGSAEGRRLAPLVEAGVVVERSPETTCVPDGERFTRQLPYLDGLMEAGTAMASLRGAHVCIVGCGGLGTWALAAIASIGVGTFTLVDDDTVAPSNLNRQILFGAGDVGSRKVDLAAAWLRGFDPGIAVHTRAARVESPDDVASLLGGVDLLVLAADWPPYELARWVNAACVAAGVPFVTSGQQPPLLRIGPTYVPGEGACFACHERSLLESYPHYAELAEHRRRHGTTATTLGPASGIIGCLLGLEALHLLSGSPVPPATRDRALLMDMRTLETRWESIRRRADCQVCA